MSSIAAVPQYCFDSPNPPCVLRAEIRLGPGFAASAETLAADSMLGRHSHMESRFIVFLRGKLREERRPRVTLEHNAGDVTFLASDEAHSWTAGPAQTAIFLLLLLDRADHIPQRHRDTMEGSIYPALLHRLYLELQSNDVGARLAVDSLIAEIYNSERQTAVAHAPTWLRRVRERLHDAPCDEPSLRALAKDVGVHYTHLARVFRAHCGCTIGEYARRIRLQRALGLLADSQCHISEIAVSLGFSDQSHFGRCFRRAYGVSPVEYRRLLSG